MNPDLRSFLSDLRATMPEQVLTIAEEVPLDYTSTALTLELERRGRHPVLMFERLAGHEGRLAANLFAAREVLAAAIGATPETLVDVLGEKLDALIPAQVGATGPVQEIVWEGDGADLTKLPIPRHFTQDAGPYITAGMVAASTNDFGTALMAVLGANAIVCTWYWVNFFMGSGMHSYGSGAGGQWQVASAMMFEGLFVIAAGARYLIKTGGTIQEQPEG